MNKLDDMIQQDILDNHDLHSKDSMTQSQFDYESEQYYKALFSLITEKMYE